jgi:biopolymer transport protein ExbB
MIPRRLYVAGLETSKQGLAAMRRAMATVIELEIVPELNFLLPTILAIAKIATPLLNPKAYDAEHSRSRGGK